MLSQVIVLFLMKIIKIHILFCLILILTISCSHRPSLSDNSGNYLLLKKINKIINNSKKNISLAIDIRSLNSRKSIYSFRSDIPMLPASNVKLYTSASAIINYGSDYQFKTRIYESNSNLYLKGGGDPFLKVEELDSLARLISKKYQNIDSLITDNSMLDNDNYGPGWMWDEGHGWHASEIHALNLNNNSIDFFIEPVNENKLVKISYQPPTKYVKIINNSKTVLKVKDHDKKFTIDRDWKNKTNTFIVSGIMEKSNKVDTLKRNIYDAENFVLSNFAQMLKKYGVKVKAMQKGKTPKDSKLILTHNSKTLSAINKRMMYESNNLAAEVLTKSLAYSDTFFGNWESGLKIIKSLIYDYGKIDTTNIRLSDGSGLSRYNLSSAKSFTTFLDYIYFSKYKDEFIKALPHGGSKKSTLENRFKHHRENIRAKTGTLSGVSCISGYLFSQKYGPLCFSIMINGFTGSSKPLKILEDEILALLLD